MKDNIMVSIICLAYNQEKYIRRALESFLAQDCDFKYEIIVHDDASTDHTADIIHEYEKKYPEIIRPIYQKENQYSKGISIIQTIIVPKARGKYLAYCEGDDYWIDNKKIKNQVDYMELHQDCSLCATNAIIHFVDNNTDDDFVEYMSKQTIGQDEEIDLDVQKLTYFYIPTASFLYPKSYYENLPYTFERHCFAGDKKTAMYLCAMGYCHFINQKTCVYNRGVENSATTKTKTKDEMIKINEEYITLYNDLNSFTFYRFAKFFQSVIMEFERNLLFLDYSTYVKYPFGRLVYRDMSIKDKAKLLLIRMGLRQ